MKKWAVRGKLLLVEGNSYRYWDPGLVKKDKKTILKNPNNQKQLNKRSRANNWPAPQAQWCSQKVTPNSQIAIHFAQIILAFAFSNLLKWVGLFSNLWTEQWSHEIQTGLSGEVINSEKIELPDCLGPRLGIIFWCKIPSHRAEISCVHGTGCSVLRSDSRSH